jgi:hypothetical protein
MTGPITPVPLPATIADTNLEPPTRDEVVTMARAFGTAPAPEGGLTPVQRAVLNAMIDSMTGVEKLVNKQACNQENVQHMAAKDFNAGHVEEVDVRREERERDDGLVEVDADLLFDAGLVADDLS